MTLRTNRDLHQAEAFASAHPLLTSERPTFTVGELAEELAKARHAERVRIVEHALRKPVCYAYEVLEFVEQGKHWEEP
jgi:hypothetical protein